MQYRVADGVSFTQMPDGSAVVLGPGARMVFELNEWAVAAWPHLSTGIDTGSLAALLAAEFEGEVSVIEADLEQLIRDLTRHEIVEQVA